MKKILFPHPLAKEFFYSKSRDNVNVPFVNLREAFEEKGYEFHIEVTGELDSYEFIFFMNVFETNGVHRKLKFTLKEESRMSQI